MADDNLMSQEEIERLLSQAAGSSPPASMPPAAASPSTSQAQSQADIEALLQGQPDKSSVAASLQASQTPQNSQTTGEDPHRLLAQNDIERLFEKGGKTATATAPKVAAEPKAAAAPPAMPGEGYMAQGDIDFLLTQAERALEAVNSDGPSSVASSVAKFSLEEFAGAPASTENTTIDLIRDVELDLKIELGRTQMYLDDVLRLRRGSVVPLDKLAGDPVDIYVNGRLIARGEVLVLNDNFCVRVAELIAGAQPVAG